MSLYAARFAPASTGSDDPAAGESDLRDMLTAIASQTPAQRQCGAALDAQALLEIGLTRLLAQAGGDIALAVEDARGGPGGCAGFPLAMVEVDGMEWRIDGLGPEGRLRALLALWSQDRMSFPLLAAVIADHGRDWRHMKLVAEIHRPPQSLSQPGVC
jgi:hypothetical protein